MKKHGRQRPKTNEKDKEEDLAETKPSFCIQDLEVMLRQAASAKRSVADQQTPLNACQHVQNLLLQEPIGSSNFDFGQDRKEDRECDKKRKRRLQAETMTCVTF